MNLTPSLDPLGNLYQPQSRFLPPHLFLVSLQEKSLAFNPRAVISDLNLTFDFDPMLGRI